MRWRRWWWWVRVVSWGVSAHACVCPSLSKSLQILCFSLFSFFVLGLFLFFFFPIQMWHSSGFCSERTRASWHELSVGFVCLVPLVVIGHLPQRSSLSSLTWFIFQGKRHCYPRSGAPAGRRRIEVVGYELWNLTKKTEKKGTWIQTCSILSNLSMASL